MLCFSGQCLAALWLILAVACISPTASADGLFDVSFGGARNDSVAFLVNEGQHVVTVGLAGRDLRAAKLSGMAAAPRGSLVDSTSRLVVFEMPKRQSGAFRLAAQAPAGGLLRTPDGGVGGRIVARVERVSGKFLPFTLLKLQFDGSPPKPGTPLLDASGAVAAVAHDSIGNDGGFALPVEVVHRALDAARQGKEAHRAWLGLILNPGKDLPQVTRTVEGSPAKQAGLLPGDVLLEVGGLKVADYGDAVNAFFLLRPGKPTRVRVKRGGGEKVLELVPAIAGR
ncbi:S1C family serine protease [Haloferula sp.]|uniref:S1C family serine protease n=1 Tax=Haloferula sp. TaxID=2497595 RepID=UPI003C7737B2